MNPIRVRGLRAAFAQGRVQKGAMRVPCARDKRGWRRRRHLCRLLCALEQDGVCGSAGMGVIGWDNARGPWSLCPALEGTAPRWWRASTGRAELACGGAHPTAQAGSRQILGACSAELEKLQYFTAARGQVLGAEPVSQPGRPVPAMPLSATPAPGSSSTGGANSSFATAWGAKDRGGNQLNPVFLLYFEKIYIYIPARFPLPSHGPWPGSLGAWWEQTPSCGRSPRVSLAPGMWL